MLSRLAFRGKDLAKCVIVRHQSNPPASAAAQKCEPAETGQRDYVNFPDIVRPEYAPPTKFGLIPVSWFDFFYPKTGYTGPYMFLTGLATYCLSKEIFILEHHAANLASLVCVLAFAHYKFGDKIAAFYSKKIQEQFDQADAFVYRAIDSCKNQIEHINKISYPESFVTEVNKLKREVVYFQMEAIYRERLLEVYEKVKKSLEYQAAVENIDRSFTHKNLVDYVMRNVLSSITPEKEKLVLDQCIADLNSLASKA